MDIPITIAGELVLDVDQTPKDLLDRLKGAAMVLNEEREKKEREKIFGFWDEPEFIPLWREEARRGGQHVLLLPRGYAFVAQALALSAGDYHLVWDDQRTTAPAAPGYFRPFLLRDYQARVVSEMMSSEQGFMESPAGSGKTAMALGLMGYLQQRAVIIVDKANLVEQWRKRAHDFLGLSLDLDDERSVGKIGEDVWEERDLTICLRQTLWSRVWQLDATSWFSRYGLVGFDEGHHLSSETLGEVCRRVTSKYLLGFSATPAKSEARGQIVHAMVGPIISTVTRQELYDREILVRPSVEQHFTDLQADFWPTHDAERNEFNKWVCQVPGCPKKGKHGHRNNYSSVLRRLVEDKDRNIAIAQRVVAERGHVHLLYSRQLKHLDLLRKECVTAGWDGPIYMLRGEENAAGLSQAIADAVEAGGQWEMQEVALDEMTKDGKDTKTVIKEEWVQVSSIGEYGREALIFSTVADEGLDIPPIDRVHLVFPGRQEAGLIQIIGRGERITPGKVDSIVVDWCDEGCKAFREQAYERERVYRKIGFMISQHRPIEVA